MNANPLRYRGYVYDTETGLYYLQSRYYDPKVGRFINADAFASTGQGVLGNNMFAYCGNNPVSRMDVKGSDYDTITDQKSFFYSDITHTYGGVRVRCYCTLGYDSWHGTVREMLSLQQDWQVAVEALFDLRLRDSISAFGNVAKRIMDYEIVADPMAAGKIYSGFKKMIRGFAKLLYFPDATPFNEISAAADIAKGFNSLVNGIGELFDWREEDR